MTQEQIIKDLWPYAVAFIGFVVWLIRLEGKVKNVEKTQSTEGERMARAIDKLAETQEKMSEVLGEMRTTLAGVVGYEKGAQEARRVRK